MHEATGENVFNIINQEILWRWYWRWDGLHELCPTDSESGTDCHMLTEGETELVRRMILSYKLTVRRQDVKTSVVSIHNSCNIDGLCHLATVLYRKLVLVDWRNEESFKGKWKIQKIQRSSGQVCCQTNTLKNWLRMRSHTPSPRAAMKLLNAHSRLWKTLKKNRNRMQLKLLGAPVRIRSHLMYSGTCCNDFVVNPCNAGPFQFTVSLRFSCLLNRTTKPVSDEEEMLLALTRQHRVYM